MTICSMVVHTRPENIEPVSDNLTKMEGVEIHATGENGKLVVSIDHPDRKYCSESIMRMSTMDGVLNATLIYEYHEEDDSEPTPMEVSK
ncbi:MAG: chaperone NapD [Thiogranum sp.]